MHTYQQAVALVLLALVLAAGGVPGLAGAALRRGRRVEADGRHADAGVLPLRGAVSLGSSAWRGRLIRVALGAVAMTGLVLGALVVRGELGGYADALRVNVLYPSLNPPDVTSFIETPSLWGRVVTLFTAAAGRRLPGARRDLGGPCPPESRSRRRPASRSGQRRGWRS
jgi:hypothetical protein